MIRVAIADDHPVILGGLVAMFQGAPGFEVVAQTTDGVALVAAVRESPCDVAVLDLRMPGTDGASATRQLGRLEHPPAVLILTTYDSPGDVLAAVEAGASGYVLKAAEPAEILAAVRAVADGRQAMSPAAAAALAEAEQRELLTAREEQVLRLLATGATNAEIGRALGIGAETVKTHTQRVFQKLGVRDRTAAAAEAQRLGLIH